MAKYVGRDADQKAFVKLFDSLVYSRSRWEIWQDMVVLIATSISNSVRHPYREQREKEYLRIIQQYKKQEQEVFAELFAMLVTIMDRTACNGEFCDFLGELYMQLGLGNDQGGQFFTPYDVCRVMAEMSYTDAIPEMIDRKGYISVNDPAVGAGALLIAWAEILRKHGINYQTACIFTAQEIDYTTALMCYIQLSLLGCAGYVRIGNTLSDPMTGHVLYGSKDDRTWYTPMFFSERWSMLRAIEQTKTLLSTVATAIPEADGAKPIANMPENGSAGKGDSEACSELGSGKTTQKPIEQDQPNFTVSTKKKNAGQIMFDFG